MNLLKEKLVEMMAWFHAFCEENCLRYYVLGGTMLGAARHQGFIPWDDDIDVGMPRKDYEKLAKLLSEKQNEKYVLETPESEQSDYFYSFSKLYDTTTTLIENTKYKIKRGIYIDIFPLDGIGNSLEESRKNYKSIKAADNLLMMRVTGVRKGRKWYKNLAVIIMRILSVFFHNDKKTLKKLVMLCKKYDYECCEWGGNLVGAWGFKEVMPKSIMGTPTLYNFENIMVYGAQDADAYLTHLYGDWSQLPPPEKRVSHHDYIFCDLEKSYLEN